MGTEDLVKRAARDIVKAKKVIALTGAGISVESGIPPFRGKGGLWEKFDPEEYAHISAFRRHPEKVWSVLLKDMFDVIKSAKPNPAHLALARLEKLGKLHCVITQNVDGLHQKAGNTDVIEFHGTLEWLVCLDCGKRFKTEEYEPKEMPPRCECGGVLKPDAVFFGEPIPVEALRRAQHEARTCDVMLVIGTSAVVYPAASLPSIAKNAGATVIEINAEATPLTGIISDYIIEGKAGEILPKIVDEVERLLKAQ
ncbi:MAG TPA: NAD-dependent deacylase [Methanomicrobia archaeon]|nr:NAD-dependent deacylase [Methanomicrobia archaeon]HEX59487.1 NAD-dependent deacylase [Methanomicrobia archaeon]